MLFHEPLHHKHLRQILELDMLIVVCLATCVSHRTLLPHRNMVFGVNNHRLYCEYVMQK